MPESVPLTSGEQDFLKQLCGFAERKATNGVYLGYFVSQSRNNQRYCVCIAIGDQADAVQQIILGAQMPRESAIEVVGADVLHKLERGEIESQW